MEITEIEARLRELGKKKTEIKREMQSLNKERNAQLRKERMDKLVSRLNDNEKADLAQTLGPKGIESSEGIGVPGAN